MIPYRLMTGQEKSASKARPASFAVCVAQAAVAEAGGSVEDAIQLVGSLRADAIAAGYSARADLATRAMAVLRFAANPLTPHNLNPAALVLESLAEAKRVREEKPQRTA